VRAPKPVWTGAENFTPTGSRSPDRPASSQSLYRLSYRVPYFTYLFYSFSLALQPSTGYGFLWLCSPAQAMASCGSAAQHGLWPPRSRGFVITYNDAPQSVGPSGRVIGSSQRTLPDNTQHTQQKNIHGKTLIFTMKLTFFSLKGQKPFTQRLRAKIPKEVNH
jgi:hypothetical protein